MHTSNTLSRLHAFHSFVMSKVLVAAKIIGHAFASQPSTSNDFSPSLCPLL
jgi:hypothetical protein